MSTITMGDRMSQLKADMQGMLTEADKAGGMDQPTFDAFMALKGQFEDMQTQKSNATKALDFLSVLGGDPEVKSEYDDQPEQWRGKSAGPLGLAISKSAEFAAFRKAHPSGTSNGTPISLAAKNLGHIEDIGIGVKADLTTGTGQARPARLPGYRSELIDHRLTLLDLIDAGDTEQNSIEYARIIAETNNAAIVPEGELKPLSDLTTDTADAKAHTFADGFVMTNQFLADEPTLAAFMQARLPIHLRSVTEQKILAGAGGTDDVLGLLNTTGTQAQAFDEDAYVTLARAIEKIEATEVEPQAIVMHPTDVWKMRLMRDNDGRFIAGGPFTAAPFAPWEVPIAKSFRMPQGKFAIGNWKSIQLLEREGLSVLAFNQHEDFARRNKVYVRAEFRAMVLNYAPREFVIGNLAAPAGG